MISEIAADASIFTAQDGTQQHQNQQRVERLLKFPPDFAAVTHHNKPARVGLLVAAKRV
jgi:hypothetical protein